MIRILSIQAIIAIAPVAKEGVRKALAVKLKTLGLLTVARGLRRSRTFVNLIGLL